MAIYSVWVEEKDGTTKIEHVYTSLDPLELKKVYEVKKKAGEISDYKILGIMPRKERDGDESYES